MPPAGDPLRAVVIGGVDAGEAHRVIHLLTAQGRLAAFAPAARASRRRFGGALQVFTTVQVHLKPAGRRAGGMPSLGEATALCSRLGLRADLDRIALAAYLCELTGAVAPEGEPAEGLLGWLEQGLDAVCEQGASAALQRVFQLGLLRRLGYPPRLEASCAACGGPLPRAYLDLERGGLFCEAHRSGAARVGPKTLAWLQAALVQDAPRAEAGFDPDWARRATAALQSPCERFFNALLGRPLKSAGLLAELS